MAEPQGTGAQSLGTAPLKVIYVMGAGRSGSTILGVALGNCKSVFYAGELDKWLTRSGVPSLEGSERTAFWSAVGEQVDASDLFGFHARALERSSALFSLRRWRARRRLRARYRQVSEDLYRAIARVAGATHIVDTSHYPLRARELQRLDRIELYLIFLVRNAQRVVESLGRSDVPERRFDTVRANAYLWLTHLLSLYVFLHHPSGQRVLLKYEDLLADPEGVVGDLLDRVGAADSTPDFTSLHTGVPIQGNRLLRTPIVALQGDPAAPQPRSRITGLLQLPWSVILSRLAPRAVAMRSPERAER